MQKRLAIIGAGNMGAAILLGVVKRNFLSPEQVIVSDLKGEVLDKFRHAHPGMETTSSNRYAVENCSLSLFAVKPQCLGGVLHDLQDVLPGKAVLSIAAGWSLSMLRKALPNKAIGIARAMPNLPLSVGEGLTAICSDHSLSSEDFDFVQRIFQASGKTVLLPEALFDGVTAVSGSSPAFFFLMLEAMGDAAVREGIPRQTAYLMAAQSMFGAAKMALELKEHPAMLKDAVCSPAGTTIEGISMLEKKAFRSVIMEAIAICAKKSRDMQA